MTWKRGNARSVSQVRTVNALAARLRRISPRAVDAAGAGALAVIALLQDASFDRPVPAVLVDVAMCATVAWRRRMPAAMTLLALVGTAAVDRVAGGQPAVLPVVLALNYYIVGRHSGQRGWALIDYVLLLVPLPGIATSPSTPSPGDPLLIDILSVWGFFMVAPFLAGRVVGTRSRMNEQLRRNVQVLEHEQRERARHAIAQERSRIARELHDVVAHSVSVMVIQTAAARRVAPTNPAAARAALHAVENCGRDALVDLRRMVGVLQRTDLDVLGATAPGLSQLSKLADHARASGLDVEIRIDGKACQVPAALDLVLFRIVQEALTNAVKHVGPAHACVHVSYGAGCLELDITDSGAAVGRSTAPVDGSGQGLVGMRERVALYGGQLQTGPRPEGGFRVHARLPLPEQVPA